MKIYSKAIVNDSRSKIINQINIKNKIFFLKQCYKNDMDPNIFIVYNEKIENINWNINILIIPKKNPK